MLPSRYEMSFDEGLQFIARATSVSVNLITVTTLDDVRAVSLTAHTPRRDAQDLSILAHGQIRWTALTYSQGPRQRCAPPGSS